MRPWLVRLTAAAEADFEGILRWTSEQFGPAQARVYAVYAGTLSAALQSLAEGPKTIGAKSRDDIAKGVFMLHVARKGRHFILFRIGNDKGRKAIEVLRLLHDAMDLVRHLTPNDKAG